MLVERKICVPIEEAANIMHNGDHLLNSIFGVGKHKTLTDADGTQLEILRLIINLVPSNELQEMIPGDVHTLPHFGQWSAVELLPQEVVQWTSEDAACALYVFSLPPVWLPWFGHGLSR